MLDCLEKSSVVGAQTRTPEHFENRRLRKFWRTTQAAIHLVEHIANLHGSGIELLQTDRHFTCRPRFVRQPRQERRAVLLDPARLLTKESRDLA